MDAIVIPVKAFGSAKHRLSDFLDEDRRKVLGAAMLKDVLTATQGWPARFVVTDDPAVVKVAASFGVEVVADPGRGLNAAVEAATSLAVSRGAKRLLVLASDIPAAKAEEIETLLETEAGVALVASPDGGTNALLRSPPAVIPTHFGPASAAAHRAAASRAGVSFASFELASIHLDIDMPADLVSLLIDGPSSRETVRVAGGWIKASTTRGLGAGVHARS